MASDVAASGVRLHLLGGFRVVVDGVEMGPEAWPLRRAAELVQLLGLGDGRRLLRDQVVEALWPHLTPEAGAANLRKAAHHARQALGDPESVVLRGGQVVLFPGRRVETDVECFEAAADEALRSGDPEQCARAAALYPGDLLPDALYAEWASSGRDRLRGRLLDVLRGAGAWQRVVELDPTDERAYRELMSAALAAGNRHGAIRWYGQLRTALELELGVRPGRESEELYERCVAGLRTAERAGARPVVGREQVLARFGATLQAAERHEISALSMPGPAGMGKSTLARHLMVLARERGWATVGVRATAGSGPYTPLVQAVEHLLTRDDAVLGALPGRTLSILAELTPLAAPATPTDGPLTRHQVIGAVQRVLLAAAGASGVLLVVDDAHLADEATLEALLHLAGVSGTGRVFVALAYRPESAPDALVRGLGRLARAGMVTVIDLLPLEHDDAARLVRASASRELAGKLADDLVDRIVELAGGNPFFLIELARSADSAALPTIPPTVRDAVAARFVDLDEGSTAMLQRLAVAGDELDPTGVLGVTGLDEEEGFALLDAALAADVLVVSGTRYRFRHDLVRQALVDQMPPHRRVAVHRDAARRLATIGGTPDAVAAHWLAGERPDDAAPWLVAAARNAVRLGAFADALRHVDSLLHHRPEHPAALVLRAEALEALGDERAPAAFAAAARVVGDDERDEVRAKQALASVRAGDPAGAMAVLGSVAARTLEGRLAQSLALAGAAAMGFADPTLGVQTAAETRRLAAESGNPSAVVISAWAEAAAAHAKGDLPRSLRSVLRETHALPDLAISVFDGQLCVAERLLYGREPYSDVIAFADALETEAERLGAARGEAFATTFRGEALLLTGRLDEAEGDLSRGAELHRAIGAGGGEALSLQRLAEVALYRGEYDRARELIDEALAVARDSDLGFHLFDRIYGTKIMAAGDPAHAMAALEEAEDAVHGSMETCPGCRIALAVPAAIAAAQAGDLERAARYEAAAERLTTILMRLPGWYAAVDEVRGHRARAAGDPAAAARHLIAAAEGFRAAGQPLDAERCERLAAHVAAEPRTDRS